MTTAASICAPPASDAGLGAARRSRRSLVTKQTDSAAAHAAASKTLDNENDCIFLLPVFTVRNIGAGNAEDKEDPDGDESSEDDRRAEYQSCVECV